MGQGDRGSNCRPPGVGQRRRVTAVAQIIGFTTLNHDRVPMAAYVPRRGLCRQRKVANSSRRLKRRAAPRLPCALHLYYVIIRTSLRLTMRETVFSRSVG